MDLQTFANLGEVVGGIAVVVSLIYLAIQLRQTNESQRTENYVRALERISATQSSLSQDGEFSRLFAKGVQDPALLTPRERIQFTWALYESFGTFEFLFHAAQKKSVPDEVWSRWSRILAWWLTFPGVTRWWTARPVPFTDSFSAYVEATIRDNPTDMSALARWSDFVAAQGTPR